VAVHGALCSGVSFDSDDSVSGSIAPLAECSGASNGDTPISVFTNHADALAWADQMIFNAASIGPVRIVVGPNWAVNTSPAFARKVIKAVGGQLLTS
jgi:hypothetical protein